MSDYNQNFNFRCFILICIFTLSLSQTIQLDPIQDDVLFNPIIPVLDQEIPFFDDNGNSSAQVNVSKTLSNASLIASLPILNSTANSTDASVNNSNDYSREMGRFANGKDLPRQSICTSTCVRRELSTLSAAEMERFSKAMKQINTRQAGEEKSWFASIVSVHDKMAGYIHGNDFFLHWHRYFLIILERKLQSLIPGFCLPYWDWPNTSQNFTSHPVFDSSHFGYQGPDGCISGGIFAGWTVFDECVTRKINASYTLSSFGVIVALTKSAKDFSSFSQAIEITPHSGPHLAIGGTMATMNSSADPLFWVHHAAIDKLWSDLTYRTRNMTHPRLSDVLPGLPIRVGDVDHAEDWCYSYAATNLLPELAVKPPSPISPKFLSMNWQINATQASALALSVRNNASVAAEKFRKNPTNFTSVPLRSTHDTPIANSSIKPVPGLVLLSLMLYFIL